MVDDTLRASGNESRAPFMEHLKELRNRLVRCAIAVGVGLLVGMFFGSQVIRLLKIPGANINLITTTLMEPLATYFQASILTGAIIAMPVLVYQFLAFASPGLTAREKRTIFSVLPFIIFMFLAGVAFAYFVALPPALTFLYGFNNSVSHALPSLSNYISLVIRILLAFGLVFEMPLIIMALARIGVVSPQWMAARRKWWILLAFIIAAFITPTPDPVDQTVVAVPLILLIELGILLARLVYKKRRPQAEEIVQS